MFWLRLIYTRLYGLLRKNRIEREMEDEMRFHLLMRTRQNIERGMRPDEAEREARRRFGNVGRIKDLARDIKDGGFMETLLQDLRYGARMLLKHPGFTAVAALTLAFGIGANTAIFSVVNAVLLRPYPYKDQDRLMWLWETRLPEIPRLSPSPANFLDWQKQNTVFEQLEACNVRNFNLVGGANSARIRGMVITHGFLSMLGIRPRMGRDFLPDEDRPGCNNVVILSHELWQRQFGGDPNILNQSIKLDDQPFTVIGVMPPNRGFRFQDDHLWTPIAFTAEQIAEPQRRYSQCLRATQAGGHARKGAFGDERRRWPACEPVPRYQHRLEM